MKYVSMSLLLIAFALSGCGPSRRDVESWVKVELQKHIEEDATLRSYDMDVVNVVLLESGDNKYDGVGTVTFQGGEKSVPLEVTVDGKRMMYQTKATAFDFVAQAEMQAAQKEMEAEIAAAAAEMKKMDAQFAADQAEMDAANDELEASLKSAEAEMDAANAELGASMQFGE